jgi:uncharacterized membrane protein YagU involved in acid resistance
VRTHHPAKMPQLVQRSCAVAACAAAAQSSAIGARTVAAVSGSLYGTVAEVFRAATAGAGTAAGAGLYLASHGSTLPLLHIQAPPWRLPRAAFVWELTSHLVFGAALELTRRGTRARIRRITM